MLQLEVLIPELLAENALSASAVVVGEVAALQHEVGNHSVERAALESEAPLSSAQSSEVLGCLRHNV